MKRRRPRLSTVGPFSLYPLLVPPHPSDRSCPSRSMSCSTLVPCSGQNGVNEQVLTTVDDGDGKHVLPVTVRLPLVTIDPVSTIPAARQSQTQPQTQSQGTNHFIPAKERKALRKLAVLESQAQAQSLAQDRGKGGKGKEKEKEKGYRRNDIRVGDTLRVRGRIDEYRRGGEWVRVVIVEPGSGGFVGMFSSFSPPSTLPFLSLDCSSPLPL
jgi:hypothetical protein